MEQMYMIEILIDEVTIFANEQEDTSKKKITVKVNFGPKLQFIIKERGLVPDDVGEPDVITSTDDGKQTWTRKIRVGKSYLFPAFPDTVLMTLSKFPLELEVWNDDENEKEIFIGLGCMEWDMEFYELLKEAAETRKHLEPLTLKQHASLRAECCCRICGKVTFLLRVSPLGDTIITEFQQLMREQKTIVFRSDTSPNMFRSQRLEGEESVNFCMVGSLYETTTIEEPEEPEPAIPPCIDVRNCSGATESRCKHGKLVKVYPIDKIKMGDIKGPCGNANCILAHRIKQYIRKLDTYKIAVAGRMVLTKDDVMKNICGKCICKDDRWHRDTCPANPTKVKLEDVICKKCSGFIGTGNTCDEKEKNKMIRTPKEKELNLKNNEDQNKHGFIVQNLSNLVVSFQSMTNMMRQLTTSSSQTVDYTGSRSTKQTETINKPLNMQKKQFVYAMSTEKVEKEIKSAHSNRSNRSDVIEEKFCHCTPRIQKPACDALDCNCTIEAANKTARKNHKPYCPSYKHRSTCPVTVLQQAEDGETQNPKEDEEDGKEKLPYGLPPIKLGPCPVLGKPCTAPEGFTRIYKTAAMVPQSLSTSGKVYNSKEFKRIKNALKEFIVNENNNEFKCVNEYTTDTEIKCCNENDKLLPLLGKSCCVPHKLNI